MKSPPTIFWRRYTSSAHVQIDNTSRYYLSEHVESRPFYNNDNEFSDSFLYITNVVMNQILFTLLTWEGREFTGAEVQRAIGCGDSKSFQSSVSSTLQSGVLKQAISKRGSKKAAFFKLDLRNASSDYLSEIRFIPSKAAIQHAKIRASEWSAAKKSGIDIASL